MSVSKDIEQHVISIEHLLNSLKEEVKSNQETLQRQREIESQAKLAAEQAQESHNILKAELGRELEDLTKGNEAYRKTNVDLRDIMEVLVTKKSQLMLANDQLQQKNTELKVYETKAMKILNAKDEELLLREQSITEKESYSSRPKSLLPPV